MLLLSIISGFSIVQAASASSAHLYAAQSASVSATGNASDFATVNPDYIYDQLFYMATHFQHRQAGFAMPGHAAFAAYWTQEMFRNLQGFGAQVRNDTFATGWFRHPGSVPGVNVEFTIPGAVEPAQVVVIGCHYDGMGNSTQSAYDDTSGCAIELGVAQALGSFWHAHHAYPRRTLRFILFDGEEQNLLGSFHYVNDTIDGDLSNIVAMFNEEQNGVGYPVRYLGRLANPQLPLYIDVTPQHSNSLYPGIDKLPATQKARIRRFRDLIQQAIPAVFQKFRELHYDGLTYHDGQHHDVAQPIFTPNQLSRVPMVDDTSGASDEVLFSRAGIPSATPVSDASYYNRLPPPWAFPYDQPQDTIQMLNTYAVGGTHKSNALTLSLAISGMITTWMLNSPEILGQIPFSQLPAGPIAAMNDVEYPQVHTTLRFDARASFNPRLGSDKLSYNWNFGDGQQASGIAVAHTYTKTGDYTLTLTISSSDGTRTITKLIHITQDPLTYPNQYQGRGQSTNAPNPRVHLPTPDDSLRDKIIHTP